MRTSQSFIVISFGLLFLSASLNVARGQKECASNVSQCVTKAFYVFTTYPDDIPRVCSATDDFLMCIITETRTCDPLVAASVKDSMSPMIEVYTAEPYNCNLESAKSDALKPDLCAEQMSYCSFFYYQASSEADYDYIGACRLFEVYLECMNSNTTACGPDMQGFIQEHSDNATRQFDQNPLYCEERIQYHIDEVDENMTKCYDILEKMNMQYAKQDYVCSKYKLFFNCAIHTLTSASPRQFDMYVQGVNEVGQSFRVRPYFCESENPCMELFKACNQSAYSPSMVPCQFMDLYTSCLSTTLNFCGHSEYLEVAAAAQLLIGGIHNKYNCIEENMNKAFEETTRIQDTTQTSIIENNNNEGSTSDKNNNNEGSTSDKNNNNEGSTSDQNDNNNNMETEVDNEEDPLPTQENDMINMKDVNVTPEAEHDQVEINDKERTNYSPDVSNGGIDDKSESSTSTIEPMPEAEGTTVGESDMNKNKKETSESQSNNKGDNNENSSPGLKTSVLILVLSICLSIFASRL